MTAQHTTTGHHCCESQPAGSLACLPACLPVPLPARPPVTLAALECATVCVCVCGVLCYYAGKMTFGISAPAKPAFSKPLP